MNDHLRELYQQVILDHNQNPKNFKKLDNATCHSEGYNPLCGDRISLAVELAGNVIQDIGFQGSGCAISKASASILTTMVKGKTVQEAENLFNMFQNVITRDVGANVDDIELGKLIVFAGVRQFPMRVKCATLAWHTLQAALRRQNEIVTTE